ncbi:hypothetical protein BD769DRAFT_1388090 [Suillus cothurnatus]|nr:hypothetical protein BD769DRAFT_1388090 [Suillus cothurnatus]
MSHEGHHSDGNGMLQSIFIVGRHLLPPYGLEDVVASNQAKLEDMLHNVHRQLHDIENAMAKSVEHHKAILQSGKVLYQKLSEEVADTRAEIGQIVDDILQNISTFHQSTTNDLAALQDSVNRWPDSYLQPTIHNTMTNTTLLSELQSAGSENSACHADNITSHWHTLTYRPKPPPLPPSLLRQQSFHSEHAWICCMLRHKSSFGHTMLGVIILAKIFRNVVHLGFMKGQTQIEEALTLTPPSGMEERLMWQFCKDAWGYGQRVNLVHLNSLTCLLQ